MHLNTSVEYTPGPTTWRLLLGSHPSPPQPPYHDGLVFFFMYFYIFFLLFLSFLFIFFVIYFFLLIFFIIFLHIELRLCFKFIHIFARFYDGPYHSISPVMPANSGRSFCDDFNMALDCL